MECRVELLDVPVSKLVVELEVEVVVYSVLELVVDGTVVTELVVE